MQGDPEKKKKVRCKQTSYLAKLLENLVSWRKSFTVLNFEIQRKEKVSIQFHVFQEEFSLTPIDFWNFLDLS